MSDLHPDWRDQLDLRKELARIDRDRAETQKLLAEARKFNRDYRDRAEAQKLFAEARKFNRDPWFLIIGAIIAAITTRLPEILHAFGIH